MNFRLRLVIFPFIFSRVISWSARKQLKHRSKFFRVDLPDGMHVAGSYSQAHWLICVLHWSNNDPFLQLFSKKQRSGGDQEKEGFPDCIVSSRNLNNGENKKRMNQTIMLPVAFQLWSHTGWSPTYFPTPVATELWRRPGEEDQGGQN